AETGLPRIEHVHAAAGHSNLHQNGYMTSIQHRLVTGPDSLLVSQLSHKTSNADVSANSNEPYRMLVETTEGGFFNRQNRQTYRDELQETYHLPRYTFAGEHHLKTGINYSYSSYDGRAQFLPVEIAGVSGAALQRIEFSPASQFQVKQHELAWFASEKWN